MGNQSVEDQWVSPRDSRWFSEFGHEFGLRSYSAWREGDPYLALRSKVVTRAVSPTMGAVAAALEWVGLDPYLTRTDGKRALFAERYRAAIYFAYDQLTWRLTFMLGTRKFTLDGWDAELNLINREGWEALRDEVKLEQVKARLREAC